MMPATKIAGTTLPVVGAVEQEQQERRTHADHAVGELARSASVHGCPAGSTASANNGESRMIQTGSIEPIQLDGAVQPKTDQSTRSSA